MNNEWFWLVAWIGVAGVIVLWGVAWSWAEGFIDSMGDDRGEWE